jgi:DNA-binding transcriptional LysR family regulator
VPSDRRAKSFKSLRLRQLRAFCACARERSYSAAARQLGVSQPAVWEQVRAIERDFGAAMFVRRGRHLLLTEDGELFLDLANRVVAGVDTLRDRFAERRTGIVRRLAITGATSLLVEEIGAVIAEYRRRQPNVEISILAGPNVFVLDAVGRGAADVGIVQFGMPKLTSPLITGETLHERSWAVCAPHGHKFLTRKTLKIADVLRTPLILEPAGLPWRNALEATLRRIAWDAPLVAAMEVNNVLAARRYVGLGLGISILPVPKNAIEFPGCGIRTLDEFIEKDRIIALWRRGAEPGIAARQFCDLARDMNGPTESKRPRRRSAS